RRAWPAVPGEEPEVLDGQKGLGSGEGRTHGSSRTAGEVKSVAEARTRPEFPARPSAAVRRAFSLIERECLHGLAGEARTQVHRRLGDVLGRGSWIWDEKRGPFKLTAGDLTLVQEIVESEVPGVLRG